MEKYSVEIAGDTKEADEFCAWLNDNGHDAQVGKSTGNFIDGECTSHNEKANDIMRSLWEGYCNS